MTQPLRSFNDDWIEALRANLVRRGIEADELLAASGRYGIAIHMRRDRAVRLDFSDLPSGFCPRINIILGGAQRRDAPPAPFSLDIENLSKGAEVSLGREIRTTNLGNEMVLRLAETVAGDVIISRENTSAPLTVKIDEFVSGRLRVGTEASVSLQGSVASPAEVVLSGGTLITNSETGSIRSVRVQSGVIAAQGTTRAAIEELLVDSEATSLDIRGGGPAIESVIGAEGSASNQLHLSAENDNIVRVKDIKNVSVVSASPGLILSAANSAQDIVLVGATHVHFETGCTAVGVRCDQISDSVPHLSGDRGAVVTGVSGPLVLGGAAGLLLEGTLTPGLELRGIPHAAHGTKQFDWTDLTLRNFTTSSGLHGRAVLARLTTASFIDPVTTDLPGWRDRLRFGALSRRYADKTVQLRQDSEYVRALTQLCREVGAPGSTRTRVAWASYRLRQESSPSAERILLAGYRLVGYGERPLPALLTWLLAAMALGLLVQAWQADAWWDLTPSAWKGWLKEAVAQAVGPLGSAFRLEVRGDEPLPAWLVLVKILVVVPLATGLLALRNFIKEK